ncbi:MAG TPA: biotin/lipoyl-containing protein, partial [Ilumatobacteraceae bacterium]
RALTDARLESKRAFGDDAVIVERYITRPRHIEVQVAGDRHGNVIDLGTRECSVQRRYQKLIEEAPAPNITAATEHRLRSSAVALAGAIGYDSLGTVEFVVDDETGDPFFLEMNTRLQVEHPVTEAVTGLDLVELQLRIAMGEVAPFGSTPPLVGHAFEVRINAEDPSRDFMAQTGTTVAVVTPAWARWDSGIVAGSVITPFYDSMVGKLIVAGPDRDTARRRMVAALDEVLIAGVRTNSGFQRWLLTQPPIVAGRVTTRFIDEAGPLPTSYGVDHRALAAVAWCVAATTGTAAEDAWRRIGRRRFTPHAGSIVISLEDLDGDVADVSVHRRDGSWWVDESVVMSAVTIDGARLHWTADDVSHTGQLHLDRHARIVALAVNGATETYRVLDGSERTAQAGAGGGMADALRAPFPAVVTEVHVGAGQAVRAGDVLVVIEAMKILHSLLATGDGVVAAMHVAPGDQVASREVLITFEEEQ